VRRGFLLISAFLLLTLELAFIRCARTAEPRAVDPEAGAVVDGVYINRYFGLYYPFPPGWKEGPQPPRPSNVGYYVLNTPAPGEDARASILIAAQDVFFATPPITDASATAKKLAHDASEADHTTPELSGVTIVGRSFTRLELRGSPLSRIVLATDTRCHLLIFTFTAAEPEELEKLAGSLDRLSWGSDASASSATDPPVPICMKGYATTENILQRAEPVVVGPLFLKIPVRIIIGTDGRVQHTHVIRAFPEQQKSIESALAQWEFKPYQVNGYPVEIETGLVFEFKPPTR
jgi:hypothetical protein